MRLIARNWTTIAVLLAVAALERSAAAADVAPLPNAHAHNDYEHDRPLLDALEQGFTSVEADVYLVEGALLVAHNREDVRAERTLERLYFDPLNERALANNGSVYKTPVEFLLLVDLKSEAEATYRALAKSLSRYPDLFSRWTKEGRMLGPVTVIISGNRPIEIIAKELSRQVAIDGRLADLEREANVELMPLVSDRWGAHFAWRGVGAMPDTERSKLESIVKKAHDRGQKVRFWATADTPEMWRELRTAGVDLINTDDLAGLAAFLRAP